MSISYSKNVSVVFLVQEGDEAPRPATEEDFLKAGYIPAAKRFEDSTPPATEPKPSFFPEAADVKGNPCTETCDDCAFLSDDHLLVELVTIPEFIGETVKDLQGAVTDLLSPIFKPENADSKKTGSKTSSTESAAPSLEDAVSFLKDVKNNVKSGLSDVSGKTGLFDTSGKTGLFDTSGKTGLFGPAFDALFAPINYGTPSKPAESKVTPEAATKPEPAKEETAAKAEAPVEEKPEFTEFEQIIIDQFKALGYEKEAVSAMRESKEFSKLISASALSEEDAKKFADMLRDSRGGYFFGSK